MLITITGKPCSGKGTISKTFCQKYNFEYVCAGDIMRSIAKEQGYNNILEFQQQNKDIDKVDNYIDNFTSNIGKTKAHENVVIDSRLAWHFVEKSFKVFVNVNLNTASKRLLNAKRENEKVSTLAQAKNALRSRWAEENARYEKLYGINNLNLKNYDLVISSTNLTPEQLADKIYVNYKKFMQNA